jgi:aminoglycoside 3-N-acetyltransferase I
MASHPIRTLTSADLDAMRALLDVFGEAFEEPDTYGAHQPDDAWLTRLMASETFVAMAAFDEGRVIGGLAGYVLPKFEQARSEFYIYDLAVAASYRRRGIADALIAAVTVEAASRGIYVVFVQADAGDEPAANLYAKYATPEQVLHFDITPTT